jgi:sulfofructose kinase
MTSSPTRPSGPDPHGEALEAVQAVEAVFVGVATLDAIALVDGYPAPDDRVVAAEVAYAGGGPAATAAVAAARLGVRTAFVGTVGDDANGRTILRGLADEGVDVSGVTVTPGVASAASVVVVDRLHDTRAISNRPAPRIDVTAGLDLIRRAPVVHVDHAGWAPLAAAEVLRPDQLVSVDAGNPIPGFDPRGVALYAPTVEALRRTYGSLETAELLARAVADGCLVVVATAGAAGSVALTADGQSAQAAAHPVDILSTLGAGDVFHGALVAAVVHGLPLREQLVFANAVAALSCRGLDGRSRIPTLAEVDAVLPATSR